MVEIKVLNRPRTESSQTQRKFFKKTAKGKVIKGQMLWSLLLASKLILLVVLRERYLRDDVSCGIDGCKECQGTKLPWPGYKGHSLASHGHFILPDSNVFLSQVCNMFSIADTPQQSPNELGSIDGSHRIAAFHSPDNSASNCDRRSSTSFTALIQSSEDVDKARRQESLGIL